MAKKFKSINIEAVPAPGYKKGVISRFRKVTSIENRDCTIIINYGEGKNTTFFKRSIKKITELKDITEKYL